MFNRKKKWTIHPEFQELVGADKLVDKVQNLEIRIKQLECSHDFKFNKWWEPGVIIADPGRIGRVVFECSDCGKTRTRHWKYLPKKEQQALKTLNLVPIDWEVKTKGAKNDHSDQS